MDITFNSSLLNLRNVYCFFLVLSFFNAQAFEIKENNSDPSKLVAPPHEGTGHHTIHELNENYRLYQISQNDIEGYSEKLSGGDYNYPGLREDLGETMISRASTGKMAFEFLTGTVPSNYVDETVSFFFYSDIDLGNSEPYDVFLNGQPLLTFQANEDGTLKILNNPGNGNATYYLVKRDANNDGIGAFRLTVPTKSILKGPFSYLSVTFQ